VPQFVGSKYAYEIKIAGLNLVRSLYRLSEGEVTNVRRKKKKTKKRVKLDDLEPAKDPKGGMPEGRSENVKLILKYLQLGQRPPGSTPR
jgi:hypothetical protein